MTELWHRLKSTKKPVLLYGTGNGADKALDELERIGVSVSAAFVGDGFVRARTFRSLRVMSYDAARERYGDFLAVMVFGSSRGEVLENVRRIMAQTELYCADVPVCGSEIFNLEYAKLHAEQLECTYAMLADDRSRSVYESVVKFKLTGDIGLLFSCQSEPDEAFESILRLEENAQYLDLGAYNGDTALDFIKRVPHYTKITAVEPNEKSFLRMKKALGDRRGVTLVNAAVSSHGGFVPFSGSGRGARVGAGGSVKSVTVDELILKDSPPTGELFIKFDVEGEEESAILSASETIRRFKPKMLVSCYHRSSDLFTLAPLVLSLRHDYSVHIRHYPCLPAWETQFYFV